MHLIGKYLIFILCTNGLLLEIYCNNFLLMIIFFYFTIRGSKGYHPIPGTLEPQKWIRKKAPSPPPPPPWLH